MQTAPLSDPRSGGWDPEPFYSLFDDLDVTPVIPEADCVEGGLYLLRARSISLAIWTGKVFRGAREKMGRNYLFDEFHWDRGSPFGTAMPVWRIGEEDDLVFPVPDVRDESALHWLMALACLGRRLMALELEVAVALKFEAEWVDAYRPSFRPVEEVDRDRAERLWRCVVIWFMVTLHGWQLDSDGTCGPVRSAPT